MKKERTLAGFNSVALSEEKGQKKMNQEGQAVLDEILKATKPKDQTHIFRGFYLEKEVIQALDQFAKGKPKGVKSEIVNEAIKHMMKNMGILD